MAKPKVEYVCTAIVKEVEKDEYDRGTVGEHVCVPVMYGEIEADSFAALIDKLIDTFFWDQPPNAKIKPYDFEPSENGSFFVTGRLETNDGDSPTGAQRLAWRRGKFTLYHAEWLFYVERRTVVPVHPAEVKAALAPPKLKERRKKT